MDEQPPVDTNAPWIGDGHYVSTILAALARRGDQTALIWRGERTSAARLRSSILNTAQTLRRLGVGPGSTIAILTEANSPLTLTARYASHLLGGRVVHLRSTNPGPHAPQLPTDAQTRILDETRAELLVTDPAGADRARAIATALDRPITLAGFGSCGDGVIDLGAPSTPWSPLSRTQAPDCASVTYTSGSTGRPKGICQSFAAWNGTVLSAYPALEQVADVMFLVITPCSHAVGVILDIVIAAGGTLLLHERFDPGETLRAIAEERVTATYMAVPQLYALLDHPDLTRTDVSSLSQLMYGGCPASPRRLAEATHVFGASLMQNYGTSEGGRISLLTPQDHQDPELLSTVGRPFPEVQVRICDPESGADLPVGQTGEVLMRSPNMMRGYLADPGLSASVLRGGWLHTADLGRFDERGYLRLVGRIDDVIKSRATKVYPATVEEVLMTHPDVSNAVVYGINDADGLEQVHAAVTLRPGAVASDQQLCARVATVLTPLHAPVRITRHDELPLTESGKVDRRLLRQAEGPASAWTRR